MKRLVIALAFLILVSGCAYEIMEETPQPQEVVSDEPVVEPEPVAEVVEETPAEPEPVVEPEPEVISDGIYSLKIDEPFTFDGKEIVVKDIDVSSAQFRVNVEGSQIIFHNTREAEIYNGLRMEVATFKSYGLTDPRTYLNFSVSRFELGDNEYLVRKGSPAELPDGSKVSVSTRISDTNVRTAVVDITDDLTLDIVEGRSQSFNNYTVTNVETFGKFEDYALLKIVPR